LRTDRPEGLDKKLATEQVACPKCLAPMLITTIEINRVSERITYRCEPCKFETVKEERTE
jgi:hypothetical protein